MCHPFLLALSNTVTLSHRLCRVYLFRFSYSRIYIRIRVCGRLSFSAVTLPSFHLLTIGLILYSSQLLEMLVVRYH